MATNKLLEHLMNVPAFRKEVDAIPEETKNLKILALWQPTEEEKRKKH